jgi:hypothetical protein
VWGCGAERGAGTGFSPSSSVFHFLSNIPPMLLNHFILVLLLSEGRAGKTFAVLNKIVLLDVGKTWTENYCHLVFRGLSNSLTCYNKGTLIEQC